MKTKMDIKALLQSNTVRIAIAGILTAIAGWLTGNITPEVAVQSIFYGLIAIFMRNGVEKSGPQISKDGQ